MGDIQIPVAVAQYTYAVGGETYQSDRIGTGGYLEAERSVLDEFVAKPSHRQDGSCLLRPERPRKIGPQAGQAGGDSGQYIFAAYALAFVGLMAFAAIVIVAVRS